MVLHGFSKDFADIPNSKALFSAISTFKTSLTQAMIKCTASAKTNILVDSSGRRDCSRGNRDSYHQMSKYFAQRAATRQGSLGADCNTPGKTYSSAGVTQGTAADIKWKIAPLWHKLVFAQEKTLKPRYCSLGNKLRRALFFFFLKKRDRSAVQAQPITAKIIPKEVTWPY